MINFDIAVDTIRDNHGFTPNSHDSSYYRTFTVEGCKSLQVRISNHGTHLWTWYDREYDPSATINYCIVFSEDFKHDSNISVDINIKNRDGKVIGQKKSFEVMQFVYDCKQISAQDAALISANIENIWKNRKFEDPLKDTTRHARVMILKPNENIKILVDNHPSTTFNDAQTTDNKTNINCSKNMNKKNTIRLTESDLKRVISESVKKVLKEQLDGNATDNPMINQLWNELMSINRGLIKEVLQKYGWGKSKELGDGVFKQIVKVSEAINTFDAVLRNTTADSDYWAMNAHEQD